METANCSSVRADRHLQDHPGLQEYAEVHLYACACTGVTIRLPYDPLQQWHWSAFVGVRQTSPVRLSSGGADRNDLIVGICDSEHIHEQPHNHH